MIEEPPDTIDTLLAALPEAAAFGVSCPLCGCGESEVKDSRPTLGAIRRRRRCGHCHQRYTTFESVAHFGPVTWATVMKTCQALERLPTQQRTLLMALMRQLARDADLADEK